MTEPVTVDETIGFRYLARDLTPLLFVQKGPWLGWIFRQHPDGFWVSVKPADKRDLQQIALRIAIGN